MGLAAATLLAQLFTVGLAPLDLGDTPPAMRSASACEPCHGEAHAEWRASRHAQSWQNPIFQREYQARPSAWCVNCHAPLGLQAAVNEGVNCAVCHVRDGRILAARHRPGSPHDTDVRADFGTPGYCAGCHQFNFPRFADAPEEHEKVVGYTAHPMQNTVAEHAAGPLAGESCRSCHAQSAGRHLYPGAHDPKMLERALELTVCRAGDDLVATVKNRGAGHRVPTGDVHRHLVLRAWRPSAPEALSELVLGRRFAPLPDGGKRLVADTTLAPGEARALRVPLDRRAAPDEPVSVELRYVYTIDEFPPHPIGEPAWVTIEALRTTASALARCEGRSDRGR
ncbi:MAG TPA: multiheme c-type cytochrome [Polyangia bacterium]|jgi:hypothetical protein|nr:multiheme c-type cytochrome [Polyangia bacterium]